MSNRQSGRTTQQILDAAPGAVFVWCNSNCRYPLALANHLGRGDLIIEPIHWLCRAENAFTCQAPEVVVDHAAHYFGHPIHEPLAVLRRRGKFKG